MPIVINVKTQISYCNKAVVTNIFSKACSNRKWALTESFCPVGCLRLEQRLTYSHWTHDSTCTAWSQSQNLLKKPVSSKESQWSANWTLYGKPTWEKGADYKPASYREWYRQGREPWSTCFSFLPIPNILYVWSGVIIFSFSWPHQPNCHTVTLRFILIYCISENKIW